MSQSFTEIPPPPRSLGTRYVVRPGDSLSGLAEAYLSDRGRWPEIVQHNRWPSIVARTGCRIGESALLYVGQVIFIPDDERRFERWAPLPAGVRPQGGEARAVQHIRSVPFLYSLDALPSLALESATHKGEIALGGSVTIQAEHPLVFHEIMRADLVEGAKAEADAAIAELLSNVVVAWSQRSGAVRFVVGLTLHADTPLAPTAPTCNGFSSESGLPAIHASLAAPTIVGRVRGHRYAVAELKAELEIERLLEWKMNGPGPGPLKSRQVKLETVAARTAFSLEAQVVGDLPPRAFATSRGVLSYAQAAAALDLPIRPGARTNGGSISIEGAC